MEYYARKDLGGGALRTLSHEIDLMHFFFGKPREVCAIIESISELNIDVDDIAYLMCRMGDNFIVSIELDYLNPLGERFGRIFGSKGLLEYSFSPLKCIFTDNSNKKQVIFESKDLNVNQMYIDQMNEFLNVLKKGITPPCSFEDGRNVMEIIQIAENSVKTKSWQNLKDEKK